MARIIKKAEERRTEILDVARRLFLSRGYDATTVNDLISVVGISKGAFYHHFASKDDVLRALVWSMAEQGLAAMVPLFERGDFTPLEKLKAFFKDGQKYRRELRRAPIDYRGVISRREPASAPAGAEQMTEIIVPHLGRVLEQGAKLGEFDIEEPEETARLVLNLGSLLHEAFAVALKLGESRRQEAIVLLRKRADSCERAISHSLQVAKVVLDNWEVSGVTSFISGSPFNPGLGWTNTQDPTGSAEGARVTFVGPCQTTGTHTFFQWFNNDMAAAPPIGAWGNPNVNMANFGNMGGGNQCTGPGINNWDLSITKRFPLFHEGRFVQFRTEMFNAPNHTQYSGVSTGTSFNAATGLSPARPTARSMVHVAGVRSRSR